MNLFTAMDKIFGECHVHTLPAVSYILTFSIKYEPTQSKRPWYIVHTIIITCDVGSAFNSIYPQAWIQEVDTKAARRQQDPYQTFLGNRFSTRIRCAKLQPRGIIHLTYGDSLLTRGVKAMATYLEMIPIRRTTTRQRIPEFQKASSLNDLCNLRTDFVQICRWIIERI